MLRQLAAFPARGNTTLVIEGGTVHKIGDVEHSVLELNAGLLGNFFNPTLHASNLGVAGVVICFNIIKPLQKRVERVVEAFEMFF